MKFWTLLLSLLSQPLITSAAHAVEVEVLQIHADYFPQRTYAIGLDLDQNHLISRIYFQDERGNRHFFLLSDLNEFTTIFQVSGIKLVRLRIDEQLAPDQARIELSYTSNYIRGTHHSLFFQVRYLATTASYEIKDVRTEQVIHQANVNTRYSAFLPIGIRSIETQP